MLGKLTGWNDTIVAPATPPGTGALGVIRLSGPDSIPIAASLFSSKDLTLQPSHSLHVGLLKEKEKALDEVVLSLFRGPRSYTGEDVIEFSCHGSPRVIEDIINACRNAGARLARAGEFTQRAFLNGKLDLVQAEGVADLIASQSEAARDTALNSMRGGFSAELKQLREQLLKFSALMELELDFSQEDVAFADRGAFYQLIGEAEKLTGILIESFRWGNVIRNGVQVAIIGPPNAGKSTLLNALLNEERAIVSEIAGTTRDTVEETLNIGGILFRLIDTAGIREHSSDRIEKMGMEKSLAKMEQADIVLLLKDAADPDAGKNKMIVPDAAKAIEVVNKSDLLSPEMIAGRFPVAPHRIFISAKSGEGIAALKNRLLQFVQENNKPVEGTVVTNLRHLEALQKVRTALTDIHTGMDNGLPGDLLTPDIRSALHYLGEITGEVTSEEQLSWIFGKFCIGK